jgi:transcriptional regulator with XRE-family HTH domain
MENQVFRTTSEWEEHVGTQIRRLRQSGRLTQKVLANRANVSLSSLQSLELGRGSTLTTVVKVMRSLDRAEWFDTLAPPQPTVSPRAQWRIAQQQNRRQVKRVRSASPRETK